MKSSKNQGGLVYSTDSGRMCPACRRPIATCICAAPPPSGAADGVVRVSRETKGRAGKGVTLIKGLALTPTQLADLGKRLRTACGTGGTVKDGAIELQGDHRDTAVARLVQEGWVVKRVGG